MGGIEQKRFSGFWGTSQEFEFLPDIFPDMALGFIF
jgi:hypothetical protein